MVQSLKRFNWREKASDMHVFALCSGALTFFVVFAPLQKLDRSRKDATVGMSLVALAFAIGLIWLGLAIKKRNKDPPTIEPLIENPGITEHYSKTWIITTIDSTETSLST